jgi:hypothetical protein
MAKHLEAEGKIVYSKTGMPRVLRPVEESKGSQLQDVWTDIDKDYPRVASNNHFLREAVLQHSERSHTNSDVHKTRT